MLEELPCVSLIIVQKTFIWVTNVLVLHQLFISKKVVHLWFTLKHTAYIAFFCPNHALVPPTFSPSIDRRGKRQIARETGGQANPCMPSAPFNFLSLFHSILCALARSDKPPHSLAHSSLLFSFVCPVQLCAPLFNPQTAHH